MNREKAIEFLASGKRVYAVGGDHVLAGTIGSVSMGRTADGVTLETSCEVVSSDDNGYHAAVYDATDIFETPQEAYYQCLSRSVYALQRQLDSLEQWRREEEGNVKKEKKND